MVQTRGDVARRLRELRRSRGLTQAELARRAGLDQRQVARVEGGRHDTRVETLLALVGALDASFVIAPREAASADRQVDEIHTTADGTPPLTGVSDLVVPD